MLKKLDYYLNNVINGFLVISMIVASLVIFVNVILRYFFNSGILGSEELVRYLMVGITFIGASTLVLKNEHLTMDAVVNYLPDSIVKILNILVCIVGIVFSFLLIAYSVEVIGNLSMSVSPALQIPSYIPYLFIPIGSFLTIIRFVERIILELKLISLKSGV